MPEACNFIKKRLQDGCFPVNIAKFLKTTISKNICASSLLVRIFIFCYNELFLLIEDGNPEDGGSYRKSLKTVIKLVKGCTLSVILAFSSSTYY